MDRRILRWRSEIIRQLKRIIAAAIIATTLFLTASFGREPDEPPEEEPITPVYDDTHEIQTMNERRQAHAEAERAEAAERQRHIAIEERKKLAHAVASKPKATPVQPSRSQDYVGKAQSFTATAYTAYCEGCSGITKTGVNLRQSIYHEGRRVIAVDPRYIPLGSIVRVTLADGSSFEAIAEDVGGLIKGAIIDVAHETTQEAYVFGRQSVEVRMIRKGR